MSEKSVTGVLAALERCRTTSEYRAAKRAMGRLDRGGILSAIDGAIVAGRRLRAAGLALVVFALLSACGPSEAQKKCEAEGGRWVDGPCTELLIVSCVDINGVLLCTPITTQDCADGTCDEPRPELRREQP